MINSRFQQKHDIEANWLKAVNFVPLAGEMIVYTDLKKFKIGDGVNYVNDLPFFGTGGITPNGGEVFGDIENNVAYGEYSSASGQMSHAGVRGYYWYWATEEDMNNNIYTLFESIEIDTEGNVVSVNLVSPEKLAAEWEVGDLVFFTVFDKSVRASSSFLSISAINGSTIKIKESSKEPVFTAEDKARIGYGIETTKNYYAAWNNTKAYTGIDFDIVDHDDEIVKVSEMVTGAHAEGVESTALNYAAHAEGRRTTARGYTSHAEGSYAKSVGDYSHAEGYATLAQGEGSHVEGRKSQAIGDYTHSEGYDTKAKGNYSHSEGYGTITSNSYAHAEGHNTEAAGLTAHAEGEKTEARGDYSHAEGIGTVATKKGQHVQGLYNKIDTDEKYLHIVGNGTGFNDANRSNAHTLDSEGNAWFAGDVKVGAEKKTLATEEFVTSKGYLTEHQSLKDYATKIEVKEHYVIAGQKVDTVLGQKATAEGFKATASGTYSHAEGEEATASSTGAHAEGRLTVASGAYSHAEGFKSQATADHSHAEGHLTTASGVYSHTEGRENVASGGHSHAEGKLTQANGSYAHTEGLETQVVAGTNAGHAEGYKTVVSKSYGHAEGQSTIASNFASHAEGASTEARGKYSHAEGNGTYANGESQHVQGRYNLKDTTSTYAHIVGNGTAAVKDSDGTITTPEKRSNAHTIDWDGNAWFAGEVKVGADAQTLATTDYVEAAISGVEGGGITQEQMEEYLSENYVTQWEYSDDYMPVYSFWSKAANGDFYRSNTDFAEEILTRTVLINPSELDCIYIPFINFIHKNYCHYFITIEGVNNPTVKGTELTLSSEEEYLDGLYVYISVDAETTVTVKVYVIGRTY